MRVLITYDSGATFEDIQIPDAIMLHKDVGHGRVISVVAGAIVSYVESRSNSLKAAKEAKQRDEALKEMSTIAEESTKESP